MFDLLRLEIARSATDAYTLEGHVADFERLEEVFRRAHDEHPDGAYLVITGDLVHGPEIEPQDWPQVVRQALDR